MYGKKYVWLLIGWYPDDWYAQPDDQITCTPEQMKEALEGHLTTEAVMWSSKNNTTKGGITVPDFRVRLSNSLKKLKENYTSTRSVPGYPEAPLAYDAVWAVALALNKASIRLEENGLKLEDFDYTKKSFTDEIYSAMNSTEFVGLSDKVRFSSEGDRIALTQIEQMIDGEYKQLATYDQATDTLHWTGKVLWKDGVPKDKTTIKLKPQVISQGLFCAMCTLAILGIFASFSFLVFNITHRYTRYIMLSQPNINNLLLVGCMLCLTCIILLGIDGQLVEEHIYPKICMARAWVLAIGFTFGYGALFSKIWTVHRIATVRKKHTKKINCWELYTVLSLLLLIDVIILTTWQTIDPLYRELDNYPLEKSTNEDEDITYQPQLEHCKCQHLNIWRGVCYGYKGLLLLFGVFLAYETRSVKLKQVNDSRVVGMSIYNVVVMSAITTPITFIIRNQQDASYAFISLAIMLCCFLSMGLIFVPKVIQVMRHPNKEGIEVNILETMPNREEEEKHDRMVASNEQLKLQIGEVEEKIVELNRRIRLRAHGLTKAVKIHLSNDKPINIDITPVQSNLVLDHMPRDAMSHDTPRDNKHTILCDITAQITPCDIDPPHDDVITDDVDKFLRPSSQYLSVKNARVSVDLNSDSGFVSGYTRRLDDIECVLDET